MDSGLLWQLLNGRPRLLGIGAIVKNHTGRKAAVAEAGSSSTAAVRLVSVGAGRPLALDRSVLGLAGTKGR